VIKFDANDMTLIETLNEEESRAFILFLLSERRRHLKDISDIDDRIVELCEKFDWLYKKEAGICQFQEVGNR
jgi:hypothetical protein